MGFLVCNKCGGYYELQKGEVPEDFADRCECGGTLKYVEKLIEPDEDLNDSQNTITCSYCSTENPANQKLCKECKKFLKPIKTNPQDKKPPTSTGMIPGIMSWFNSQSNKGKSAIGLGIVCIVGLILFISLIGSSSPYQNTEPLHGTELDQYKAQCQSITFSQLVKDPDSYKGKKVKYTGIVRGIEQNGKYMNFTLFDSQGPYAIYVYYPSTTAFAEGDMVTVYGTVYGSITYPGTNFKIVVPQISARVIEKS